MLIGLVVFPYLIGGIVMWFVAHMVAPVGYTLSLSRGVVAVVLMACSGEVARSYLRPIVGDWCILAELAIPAAVGMVILQLPFWRSLLALLAYTVIVVAATIAVGFYVGRHKTASHRLHTSAMVALHFPAEGQERVVGDPLIGNVHP